VAIHQERARHQQTTEVEHVWPNTDEDAVKFVPSQMQPAYSIDYLTAKSRTGDGAATSPTAMTSATGW
jgi:hypothetical protein